MLRRRKRSGTLTLNWLIRKLFVVKKPQDIKASTLPKITFDMKYLTVQRVSMIPIGLGTIPFTLRWVLGWWRLYLRFDFFYFFEIYGFLD